MGKQGAARTAGVVGHQVGAGGLVDALGGLRVDSVLTGALGRALEPGPTPGPAELFLDASGGVIQKPAHSVPTTESARRAARATFGELRQQLTAAARLPRRGG